MQHFHYHTSFASDRIRSTTVFSHKIKHTRTIRRLSLHFPLGWKLYSLFPRHWHYPTSYISHLISPIAGRIAPTLDKSTSTARNYCLQVSFILPTLTSTFSSCKHAVRWPSWWAIGQDEGRKKNSVRCERENML